jgi:two-component system sensor histidine kinase KdpD
VQNLARYPTPGNELGIAQWAYDHQEKAGLNTDTLASANAIYIPLKALKRCIGVLGLRPVQPRQLEIPEQMHLVEALVNHAAVAIERVQLAESAQAATLEVEAERLRNVLLSSISLDLRTPLATIIGSASTLRDDEAGRLDLARRRTLLDTLLGEAERMNRLIGNLLDLTRFMSGKVAPKREAVALDEVIGAVLTRLAEPLSGRRMTVEVPADLPLVGGDEVMLEQVIANLVENAIKHTPAGAPIELRADLAGGVVTTVVRDHGPGLPAGHEARVFEKFHRGRSEGAQSGFGLGLTICKYIVEAHGGVIVAQNAAGGGAEFRFSLPLYVEANAA